MTLQQWWMDARKRLFEVYDEREASTITQWLLEDTLKLNRTTFQLRLNKPLTDEELLILNHQLQRLANGEPLQYVTEIAEFHGHKFRVGPEVLIPRPETEELVDLILKSLPPNTYYKLLDIGTGSGCIPISLQLARPDLSAYGLDVSPGALAVAKWNSAALGATVNFTLGDFLNESIWDSLIEPDVLVSNPPYIGADEAKQMGSNVLNHEPTLALFPTGDDVLVFYRKLAKYAAIHKPHYVFAELNPKWAYETAQMFVNAGYNVGIIPDMQGKDRMMHAAR